jgi:hypothetical protein
MEKQAKKKNKKRSDRDPILDPEIISVEKIRGKFIETLFFTYTKFKNKAGTGSLKKTQK